MKFRRLPPLHTLEAFEAAARRASFKLAAQELHLTPSAVSHQIKALEDFLGFGLFRRGNRSLELTDGGKAYLQVVRETLAKLRSGSAKVAQRYARATLKITSRLPGLTRKRIHARAPSAQARAPAMISSLRLSFSSPVLGSMARSSPMKSTPTRPSMVTIWANAIALPETLVSAPSSTSRPATTGRSSALTCDKDHSGDSY